MATAKQNTSLVKNAASRLTLNKGKKSKSKSRNKRNSSKKRGSTKQTRSRRRYRKNSGAMGLFATLLTAGIGALIINVFDAIINRFVPSTSQGWRTAGKGGIGLGLLLFGNKLPYGRKYAPTVGGAFIFAASLDLVGNVAMPALLKLFGVETAAQTDVANMKVVSSKPAQDLKTGEMGMAHRLENGTEVEIYRNNNNRQWNGGSGAGSPANWYQPQAQRGMALA